MSLAENVRIKENELRFIKDHEAVVVFDSGGNTVLEKHGGSSSVDLSPYLDQIRGVGKAVLIHNHPLGWQYPPSDPRHAGSSFSPEDAATACYAELAEIRAVGPIFRFVMRPSQAAAWNGHFWVDSVSSVLEKHKAAVIRTTLNSVKSHKMTRASAEADFWHWVWRQVAADLSLSYERYKYE